MVSQRHKFGSKFLSYFPWESKIALFFNFPVSRERPEKLCVIYWLQLRITFKSGWIAQAEKRYCVSKEGKVSLLRRGGQCQGCALTYGARSPEAANKT